MREIQSLLNQVSAIRNKNSEILEATGGRFNMFQILGVNHYENTHSSILAELLNSKGTHSLKGKLLECFIKNLGDSFTIIDFDFENSRIKTEHSTEEGRIDILIEDNKNKAIIIENKIYANDQPNQLKRYNKYAKTYKNGYQILYLTLRGYEASEQSGGGINYLSISYKEDIVNWLEQCVAISSRFPIVRETIIQYINHVKQLTNQDMDTKNKIEITEILSTIDNLKSAKVIFQNYSATYNFLAEKYFNPKMLDFAKQKGLDYHFEWSAEETIKFYLTSSQWQGKYWIGFTFESNRCHYGLCNNPDKYRISNENRKILHENLNKLEVFNRKESNWWPFYAFYNNLTIDSWENDIIHNDIFLNECKSKIDNLLSAIEGVNL